MMEMTSHFWRHAPMEYCTFDQLQLLVWSFNGVLQLQGTRSVHVSTGITLQWSAVPLMDAFRPPDDAEDHE